MTTASQMLRDDQRLRNLHRETKRRRRRFLAKQKRLEDEEQRRRKEALKQRRAQQTRHTSLRRNGNRKREHGKVSKTKQSPVRVQRRDIVPTAPNPRNSPSFIVPVCDHMASPPLSPPSKSKMQRPPHKLKPVGRSAKCPDVDMTNEEDLKREEEFDYCETEEAMSDQLSVAELEQFEKRHFGVHRSIENKAKYSMLREQHHGQQALDRQSNDKENKNHNGQSPRSGGYQALFQQKVDYNTANEPAPEAAHKTKERDHKSLFSITDVDMKTPEDNDSVKINPKDSIDCSKMSFSSVHESNLQPLQSVFGNFNLSKPQKPRLPPAHHHPSKQFLSKLPEPTKRLQSSMHRHAPNRMDNNYGIKLPRLTRSILKEKDRLDSRHQAGGPLAYQHPHRSPLKSVLSAPTWNHMKPKDIGYNIAVHRKRQTSTIIDDFFKTSQEFTMDRSSNRQSNHTLFLPQIKRPRPKTNREYPRAQIAHSVMAEQDILRKEQQLKQSLDRLNDRLSTLDTTHRGRDPVHGQRSRNRVPSRNAMYTNYIGEGKVASIPRKLKVKKSPTFKSSRQRRRWNL